MTILSYLEANPHIKPQEILVPEDCAMCEIEGRDGLFHVYIHEDEAVIEELDA
jgi:hypothetical protein